MLHRFGPTGLVVITQPTHAWISGQVARAWGNERFGTVEPREAVLLAAEQHDLGWDRWEQAPTFNRNTGYPHSFLELSLEAGLGNWWDASSQALTLGRYPALLVSLHGAGLYQRRNYQHDSPSDMARAHEYLAREAAMREWLLADLGADPFYAPFASAPAVERNRKLVAAWDSLSLGICGALRLPMDVRDVPTTDDDLTLHLSADEADSRQLRLDPWPFAASALTIIAEGRRVAHPFVDEEDMRSALRVAPWLTLEFRLRPIPSSG